MIFQKCVLRSDLRCCSGCDAVQAILVPFIQTERCLSAELWKTFFKPWVITDEIVFAP